MHIEMTKNTLWQNLMIKRGTVFTVPDDIGIGLVKRGVAKDKNSAPSPDPIVPKKKKEKKDEVD